MSRLMLLIAAVFVAPFAAAAAPSAPRVVLHPMAVGRGVPMDNELAAALALEVARQPVVLVDAEEAAEVMGKRLCAADEKGCLAALARATRARFALRVELTGSTGNWALKAVVVRDDEVLVRKTGEVTAPVAPDKPIKGGRLALKKLLETIDLGNLNAATAVAEAEPASQVEDAPREDARLEATAPARGGAVRFAGVGLGIGGLALLGVGIGFGVAADNQARDITPDGNGNIPQAQLPVRKEVAGKATAATVLGIVGGAAAATGLLMILLGGPAEPAAVSFMVHPQGASVSVRMELP